jgi:hypothetical protein
VISASGGGGGRVSVHITSGSELMSGQQQSEKVHFKALHPPKVTRMAMATAYIQSMHPARVQLVRCNGGRAGCTSDCGVVWRELFFDDDEGCCNLTSVFDECV